MDKLLIKLASLIAPIIAQKLMAVLPVIAAAIAKAVMDQVISRIPVLGDLPALDLPQVADQVRDTVNQLPDIDIPVLSDIFDLSEWLKRPR